MIVIWENTLAEPARLLRAIAKACARNMHVALAAGTMLHNLHPQVPDHRGGVHGVSGEVLRSGFILPATGLGVLRHRRVHPPAQPGVSSFTGTQESQMEETSERQQTKQR